MHQSYHRIISEKCLRKTTYTSNVVQHCKTSAVNLFLVHETIVWNEGATKTGRGCCTIWVTKNE